MIIFISSLNFASVHNFLHCVSEMGLYKGCCRASQLSPYKGTRVGPITRTEGECLLFMRSLYKYSKSTVFYVFEFITYDRDHNSLSLCQKLRSLFFIQGHRTVRNFYVKGSYKDFFLEINTIFQHTSKLQKRQISKLEQSQNTDIFFYHSYLQSLRHSAACV